MKKCVEVSMQLHKVTISWKSTNTKITKVLFLHLIVTSVCESWDEAYKYLDSEM